MMTLKDYTLTHNAFLTKNGLATPGWYVHDPHPDLWHLTDYVVTSRSGVVAFIVPRKRP